MFYIGVNSSDVPDETSIDFSFGFNKFVIWFNAPKNIFFELILLFFFVTNSCGCSMGIPFSFSFCSTSYARVYLFGVNGSTSYYKLGELKELSINGTLRSLFIY